MANSAKLTRDLAAAIRERRAALGMSATQQAIAHRARISLRHLQKIEHGECTPRLETLVALAEALRTNLQSLLDRAEDRQRRRRPAPSAQSRRQ